MLILDDFNTLGSGGLDDGGEVGSGSPAEGAEAYREAMAEARETLRQQKAAAQQAWQQAQPREQRSRKKDAQLHDALLRLMQQSGDAMLTECVLQLLEEGWPSQVLYAALLLHLPAGTGEAEQEYALLAERQRLLALRRVHAEQAEQAVHLHQQAVPPYIQEKLKLWLQDMYLASLDYGPERIRLMHDGYPHTVFAALLAHLLQADLSTERWGTAEVRAEQARQLAAMLVAEMHRARNDTPQQV